MSISKLVRMKVTNIGCIGPEGIEIQLDDIVCLVGANNVGKSTILRAYEAAVTTGALRPDEISRDAGGQPATVELWVHIPAGAENIDEKWKEPEGDYLLVRSKWEWPPDGRKPTRSTWDPSTKEYAESTKASGLDTVFDSRLPRPFRIGALEDPADEHGKLLELVLEPVKRRLNELMQDEASGLRTQVKSLQQEAEKPVAEFKTDLAKAEERVNDSYSSVFHNCKVRLSVSLGQLTVDPAKALVEGSGIEIVEPHGQSRWTQQGTGSQRALFWSMLEVRSELNRLSDQRRQTEKLIKDKEKDIAKRQKQRDDAKTAATKQSHADAIAALEKQIADLKTIAPQVDTFLPGYMLLIEEPETALHPSAIRAAKEHLYSLAAESGWQVMLTTHSPYFVDPLKDHTTIVRLNRPEEHLPPNVYRADRMNFTVDERQNLKMLLAFDPSVAEMFFGAHPIIVEGDTEFAAFAAVFEANPGAFPVAVRPLILRARGKAIIPLIARMLTHFKIPFSVLHDVDAPKLPNGNVNGMFTMNATICAAVASAMTEGIAVGHECSCPFFEEAHHVPLAPKDKPFESWRHARSQEPVRESIKAVLDALSPKASGRPASNCYMQRVGEWSQAHAPDDPQYRLNA